MNEIEMNAAVWKWLRNLPGAVEGDDSAEVVRKAWDMFGEGDPEMFKTALAQHGFKPEPLGNKFILRLPSVPTGGANFERHRRLHNLTG